MQIHIAFLCPHNNQWIGGWDRKYGIYYKNLDEIYFDKYMIYVTNNSTAINTKWREVILTEDMIEDFCREKGIEFIYFGGAKISRETEDMILRERTWLVNVNFTPIYTTDPRKMNLIISMTDYWKLRWMHGTLSKSHVVYNPIDVTNWKKFQIEAKWIYRERFTGKKHIIGRMARAEPSKWHWLILATLSKLDREENYSYGFIFAGLPWLYRKWIQLCLSKKMQDTIVLISEQREHSDIAELYASIDIFWQASWIWESFGNVIAEAACFDVPTITDYKAFYQNGIVNPLLYDAQIELVDAGKTGTYSSTPEWVIRFLEWTSVTERQRLWHAASEKISHIYDIRYTAKNLASILYHEWRKNGIYEEDVNFENIQAIPDERTLSAYETEYGKRVAIWQQFDTISTFSKYSYLLSERLWRGIEYIYLMVRKWLKKYRHFDIEKL